MSKKRIVLSDEEDDPQEDTAMDLGETASAQKLTESIHHMKVSDSASKPPRYQSVRKKLFDEDEDERDKSKSNASRNGSRRTQVLSGKKEVQRAKAAAEIQRFRAKGLDAVNFDSDEEYEVNEDDEDEDEEDNDGDIDGFIVDDDDEEEEVAESDDDDEVVPLKRTTPPRRDILSAPKKPTRRASTTPNKSPRRSSSALLPRSVPSAETRKAFSEYRGGRESDDEPYASDMDDFIVADDVSVDDAAQEAAASESDDDAEMDGVEARNGEDDDSVGGRAVRKTLVHTKSPPVKPSKSKSTSQRKTVVLLSDEEGADQEEEETPHVSKSTKKRRVRRTLFSASDDDDDDDGDEGSAVDDHNGEGHGDEEDEEDNEVDDGPLLYWKLNAQMDEAADGGNDSDDLDVAGQLFSMNHKYTLEEAFAKYLELLGKVLISPSFRRQIQERSLSRHQMVAYDKACRQIENLVCTHRESLLGSSAWQGDFLQELQHRPFYMCPQSTVAGAAAAGCCGDDHRCAACGRAAKEAFFNVYLHGPSYDGMAIWSQKWVQSLPTCVFLHRDDEEDAEDADDFDAADRADRNRRLSGNKRNRSHRYLSYEEAAEAAEQGQLVEGGGVDGDEGGGDDDDDDEDSSVAEAFQHRHKRNKQFSAFQQRHAHGTSAAVALSSALKTPSATSATTTTTTKKRSRAEGAMGLDDDDVVDNGDSDEEEAVEMRKSSNKKRRVVILSESEHDNDDGDEKDETAGRRARGHDSSLTSRRPTPAKLSSSGDAAAGDVIDMTDASDQPSTATAKWWNKALPRALNQESETRWELSIHCKNRTNLYHTLLHYKFRLMLKIREQLERLHQRQSEGAYAGLSLEELPPAYVSSLLRDLLDPQRRHRSLVVQETDRLQVLLRTAEKRYGGDKYETQVDIWGTETLPINSSRGKSSSSSGGSSSSSSSFAASAAPVFSAKTTRQLKLIKKDFRTTSTGGSSSSSTSGAGGISVMGEPRRAAFQARISSWLTPKN